MKRAAGNPLIRFSKSSNLTPRLARLQRQSRQSAASSYFCLPTNKLAKQIGPSDDKNESRQKRRLRLMESLEEMLSRTQLKQEKSGCAPTREKKECGIKGRRHERRIEAQGPGPGGRVASPRTVKMQLAESEIDRLEERRRKNEQWRRAEQAYLQGKERSVLKRIGRLQRSKQEIERCRRKINLEVERCSQSLQRTMLQAQSLKGDDKRTALLRKDLEREVGQGVVRLQREEELAEEELDELEQKQKRVENELKEAAALLEHARTACRRFARQNELFYKTLQQKLSNEVQVRDSLRAEWSQSRVLRTNGEQSKAGIDSRVIAKAVRSNGTKTRKRQLYLCVKREESDLEGSCLKAGRSPAQSACQLGSQKLKSLKDQPSNGYLTVELNMESRPSLCQQGIAAAEKQFSISSLAASQLEQPRYSAMKESIGQQADEDESPHLAHDHLQDPAGADEPREERSSEQSAADKIGKAQPQQKQQAGQKVLPMYSSRVRLLEQAQYFYYDEDKAKPLDEQNERYIDFRKPQESNNLEEVRQVEEELVGQSGLCQWKELKGEEQEEQEEQEEEEGKEDRQDEQQEDRQEDQQEEEDATLSNITNYKLVVESLQKSQQQKQLRDCSIIEDEGCRNQTQTKRRPLRRGESERVIKVKVSKRSMTLKSSLQADEDEERLFTRIGLPCAPARQQPKEGQWVLLMTSFLCSCWEGGARSVFLRVRGEDSGAESRSKPSSFGELTVINEELQQVVSEGEVLRIEVQDSEGGLVGSATVSSQVFRDKVGNKKLQLFLGTRRVGSLQFLYIRLQ